MIAVAAATTTSGTDWIVVVARNSLVVVGIVASLDSNWLSVKWRISCRLTLFTRATMYRPRALGGTPPGERVSATIVAVPDLA